MRARRGGALLLLLLASTAGAGGDEEERAVLDLQALLGAADPAAVIADAERFRARFPKSAYLPSVLLAEMRALEARREFLRAKAVGLGLLAHAPESVPARAVLASFEDADDCATAVDSVVEAYLNSGDPDRLAALRRLVSVVLASRPDMESSAEFVLETWALLRDDEAMAARLDKATAGFDDKYKEIAGLLRLVRKDPVEACTRLEAHPDGTGAWCAAILIATGALDGADATAARLARARAELRFRGRTDPAPLIEPEPATAEHAALAAFALASVGRRDEARTLAGGARKRFSGDRWAATLGQLEEILAGPPPDVASLVEKVFAPALEDLFKGAERWQIVMTFSEEPRDVEASLYLDFAQREWRLIAKSKGQRVAIFHGRGERVRFWLADEPRIYEMPLGGLLPAFCFDLAQNESGSLGVDLNSVSDLAWTEMGKANEALLRNPLFSTPEGITSLVSKSPRLVLLRQAGESTCRWSWPSIYDPGFRTLEARFEKGRLAALSSEDGQATLRYGGKDDVPAMALDWPDLPVEERDDLATGQVLQVIGRLMQKLGIDQPGRR